MADEVRLKKGDVLPVLQMTLRDSDGAALDLTAVTAVTFRMRARGDGSAGELKVNSAGSVVAPATGGVVEYAWQAADVNTVGVYDAEWALTYPGGGQTVPTAGYTTVIVEQSLS